ncbi:hypothetical protein DFQ27_002401 [Actinomortierella ambigua]|uniref:Ion transport domain-containing protein n=1 Tax=Actinomortierella ambigua TaxID=1343610 RepID=A0A9P6QN34_9FUNG|nr:hypothetical protein DFQ27_002401 [Actinomortierella ambigua]
MEQSDKIESDYDPSETLYTPTGSSYTQNAVDWWNTTTGQLYQRARRDQIDFSLDTQRVSIKRAFTAASREVHERLFVYPPNVAGESLFGIELPNPATTPPPPESLFAYFENRPPASPSSSSRIEQRSCQELVANFSHVAAGPYKLLLRVKAHEASSVHLDVHVKIRYGAEHLLCDTAFSKLQRDSSVSEPGWHYLMAKNQIEIRPHEENAWVNIRIMRDEKSNPPSVGKLWIRSVELVPVGHDPTDRDAKCFTTGVTLPDSIISTNGEAEKGVIVRIAQSKDGNYLAALRLLPDTIVVHVWLKADLISKDVREKDVSNLGASFTIDCRTATRTKPGENVSLYDISLGLAISALGDQIAVYQMPRIGDWQDGKEAPTVSVGFHLFRNPIANKETPVFVYDEPQIERKDGSAKLSRNTLTLLETPKALKDAIGYASYVGQYDDYGGKPTPAKFIFCTGCYLDVFEVNSNGLVPSHIISLEGLIPTLSRRFACETTMDSICENMFLWVEEGGQYCSIWNLSNGSAIKRLEISRMRYDNINSVTKMSVTRSQSIVAIVGFDNSITTFFADTGIEISRRLFMDRRIESICFASNQSTELFVVLRERSEEDFSSITLDPFRLDIEFGALAAPLPVWSATSCNFEAQRGHESGMICQPDADFINLYHRDRPIGDDGRGGQGYSTPSKPRYITTSDNIHYELKTKRVNAEDKLTEGEDSSERLVEIWKISENPPTESTERTLVFSFVPEPWEQRAPSHGFFLPTGDRFVVYANRTIQVWGLPVDKEPCKLLYFWSMFQPQPMVRRNKKEMELVLIEHKRFGSIQFRDYPSSAGQTRIQVNVVPLEQKGGVRGYGKPVHIPNWPARMVDSRNTIEDCFHSIRLLALAYTIVSSGYVVTQDVGLHNTTHEAHASAILDFVNNYINHTIYLEHFRIDNKGHRISETPMLVTLWNSVLMPHHLPDICAKLITDLLNKEDCAWIPRKYKSMNPILTAIRRKNTAAVEVFVDYCVRKTTERHPAYMLPVVQSFDKISSHYPGILKSLLKNSSYIPAQSMVFNKAHVTVSGFNWRRLVGLRKPNTLEEYEFPVFSHHLIVLPPTMDSTTRIRGFLSGITQASYAPTPTRTKSELYEILPATAMPENQNVEVPYGIKIYVAPFPGLSTYGTDIITGSKHSRSQFSFLSGRDFADNPAMTAVLRFKKESAVNLGGEGRTPSDVLKARYMDPYPWKGIIAFDLFLGAVFLLLEAFQLYSEGFELYVTSVFNWQDVISIALAMMCQLFELRVYRPLGIIVNIILRITYRIAWFFIIFAILVVGFTHTLIYVLYTSKPVCVPDESGKVPDNILDCTTALKAETDYPDKLLQGISGTLFFLAGRYDFLDKNFASDSAAFHLTVIIFYFFMGLVLLNVLIALMNDSVNQCGDEGQLAWLKQWSKVLDEVEMIFLRHFQTRQLRHLFPDYIYYAAPIHDAEEYHTLATGTEKD